jgi:hypothetical protein
MMGDDYYRLRISQTGAEHDTSRRQPSASPLQFAAFVGRIAGGSSAPTTPSKFYLVNPVSVLGIDGEGNLGSLSVNGGTAVLVYMLGPHAPSVGDDVICRLVSNRWVAERMSRSQPSTIPIPGCLCTATPIFLHMTSSNTTANGGMFQNCALSYISTPNEYSLLFLSDHSFLSSESFTDLYTGDSFRYYLTCASGIYELTRVFVTSIFGSPFKEPARYTWLMFAPGNTCTPFLISNGQVFSGGDPSCVVTISG